MGSTKVQVHAGPPQCGAGGVPQTLEHQVRVRSEQGFHATIDALTDRAPLSTGARRAEVREHAGGSRHELQKSFVQSRNDVRTDWDDSL